MQRVTRARAEAVFAPILKLLHAINQTGCVDSAQGRPIFKVGHEWFEAAPAISGVVDYLDIAIARHDWPIRTRPLELIGLRLAAGVPLSEDDITRAREVVRLAINLSMMLTRDEAADILRTVQIRHKLEAA